MLGHGTLRDIRGPRGLTMVYAAFASWFQAGSAFLRPVGHHGRGSTWRAKRIPGVSEKV